MYLSLVSGAFRLVRRIASSPTGSSADCTAFGSVQSAGPTAGTAGSFVHTITLLRELRQLAAIGVARAGRVRTGSRRGS
ncbi:hypothetical protein EGT56_07600 [Arachnia propionica]|nr:hypothetical protein EGT56_07600 [Arachnia propionica]